MAGKDNIRAFEKLVIDYHPRLCAYVRHFIKSDREAEDLVQDAYMSLWKSYPDRVEDYTRLVYSITRNKCLNWLRQHKFDQIAIDGPTEVQELLYNKVFSSEDSSTLCLMQELQKQVDDVLDSLTPRCREVFMMSRYEHLKNREISEKLGLSHTTVERHIKTAVEAFNKALKNNKSIYFAIIAASLLG